MPFTPDEPPRPEPDPFVPPQPPLGNDQPDPRPSPGPQPPPDPQPRPQPGPRPGPQPSPDPQPFKPPAFDLSSLKDMFSGWGSASGAGSQHAFFEAVRTNLSRTLDVKGRTGRTSFWYFALAMFAASILVGVALASEDDPMTTGGILLLLSVPLVTASVRRLHDTDRTGWWALLFAAMLAPNLFVVLAALAGLIYLLAQPDDPGPNRFGAPPV